MQWISSPCFEVRSTGKCTGGYYLKIICTKLSAKKLRRYSLGIFSWQGINIPVTQKVINFCIFPFLWGLFYPYFRLLVTSAPGWIPWHACFAVWVWLIPQIHLWYNTGWPINRESGSWSPLRTYFSKYRRELNLCHLILSSRQALSRTELLRLGLVFECRIDPSLKSCMPLFSKYLYVSRKLSVFVSSTVLSNVDLIYQSEMP